MQESLFSPVWYRVATQHPHLRPEVRVQRQQVRDERWYLLLNAANGRQFRVNQKAYEFIGRCNGQRSVQEIWDELLEQFRDDAPTQDEVVQTLNELDQQELLAHEGTPDAKAMVKRRDERAKKRVQGFVNPFALRVPLGDPSALLQRFGRLPAILFNAITFWLWLVAVSVAAALGASHFGELGAQAAAHMLTPRYLVLSWLAFPVIKALHELGHALAVRRWGGEVHEAGFTLFVLVPAPYVDASASAGFAYRSQRLIVSAAGIMVELFIAAIALAVWLNVQPGLIRDLAFVTMFIASVSTVMFNGNPLLRFDAYFILCDALNLPNLDTRSRGWWMETLTRALGGAAPNQKMQLSRGERKWLFFYAPASFVFRFAISCALVLWVGGYSAVLGVVAALVLGTLIVVKPLASAAKRLYTAVQASGARWRGAAAIAASVAATVLVFGAIPLPFHTVASGIVSPPEHAVVRAGTDGFIAQILARDGDWVTRGQVLLVLEDPALHADRERLTKRLEQLQAGRYAAFTDSSEHVSKADEEIARVQAALQRTEQKLGQLELRAQSEGRLVMPRQDDLPGTFARQGMTLAHVLDRSDVAVRAAIPEYDAMLVRESVKQVEVRLTGQGATMAAEFVRDIPAATFDLPSLALGDRGGGPHATDPADKDGLRTREPIVLIDLKVPSQKLERIGGKVWVRFDHGAQPLAQRWYRQVRQVLLHHFNPAG